MPNVLVTGAGGFLGTNLTQALARRGHQVFGLVRRTPPESHPHPALHFRIGDVRDPQAVAQAVRGMDVVFHLAGRTQGLRTRDYYEANTDGTLSVARACAEQPAPPRFLFVSSLAAAGPSPPGRPRTETDPPMPVSHYGRSKRLGEQGLESLAGSLPATVIRPAIVLGPHDRVGFQMFQAIRLTGVHCIPAVARVRYSLIHVEDLVELLIHAAERAETIDPALPQGSGQGKGYYFAAYPEAPPYAELGQLVAQSLGRRRALPLHLASPIVWLAGAIMEGYAQCIRRTQYISIDRAREMTAGEWWCSPQKAISQLGLEFPVPLAERLASTAAWYREHGWL